MDILDRARLYGHAVALIEEHLGPGTREKVMEHFARLAGPMQRGGWRDPWEMIQAAARSAGVPESTLRALRIAYLVRIDRAGALRAELDKADPEVLDHLRQWGILGRLR